jgi:peptidoglycan/xylan/chitin deacetylase (PgdA/CDA1 family)
MSRLKHAVLQLGFRAGLFRLAQLARRRQALILTFHRFAENGQSKVGTLPIRKFAEYMEYLTRHRRVVSLSDMVEEMQRGMLRPYTTAVTVDDGYDDAFSLAAPVLRRYGVPATFFVVSDFIDGRLWLWPDRLRFVFKRAPLGTVAFRHRGSMHLLVIRDERERRRSEEQWLQHAKSLAMAEREVLIDTLADAYGIEMPIVPPSEHRPMTWAQLRALAADGFEVGAHTRTHPILSRIGPEQLHDEIRGSKEQIERSVGFPVRHFAYPNGQSEDYTPEVVAEVSKAGYLAAVTAVPGWNTASTSLFELHRAHGETKDLARFAQCASGFDLVRFQMRQEASKWFACAKRDRVGTPR